jgi:hypothetical protein
LTKTTSHTDNNFKMIIHICERDVFQMCSGLSHRFSTWESMIAEMALVGSDKKVRTTDSPDIHVETQKMRPMTQSSLELAQMELTQKFT